MRELWNTSLGVILSPAGESDRDLNSGVTGKSQACRRGIWQECVQRSRAGGKWQWWRQTPRGGEGALTPWRCTGNEEGERMQRRKTPHRTTHIPHLKQPNNALKSLSNCSFQGNAPKWGNNAFNCFLASYLPPKP